MFEKEIKFIRSLFPQKGNIPLHEPCFLGKEKEYIIDAIDSTFVSSIGHYVNRFEEMMCSVTGARFACATVNGTSALHAALVAMGVQKGDEVITQPLTFVGTANAITYCGADPVFLDVDMDTLGLSFDALENFLNKRAILKDGKTYNKVTGKVISACLPVHIFGHPCRIDKIVEICSRHNIPVVEDCAESLGSHYKGKHTGRFGFLGVFSFNGNKIVTAGGGGVIITDNTRIARKIKHITTTAKVKDDEEFYHDDVGFNYRMPNLNEALACAQMENLHFFVEDKRELASKYKKFFNDSFSGLNFFSEPDDSVSIYWLNTLVAKNKEMRSKFLKETNEAKIMTRPLWRLMNHLEMYKNCQTDSLENASWLEKRIINIPSSVRP